MLKARPRALGADRQGHRLHGGGMSPCAMQLTGAQALVRLLLAEQVRCGLRHRRRQAGAAAACAVAAAAAALRRPAARGRGADDGRGGVRRHRPRRGGAGRDGARRAEPRVRRWAWPSTTTCRCCRSPPTSTAPPPIRTAACSWTWTRGRDRAAHQVERGGARRAPHARAGAHAPSARRLAAGPGRCTWTSRRTCWRSRAASPTTSSTWRRRATAPSHGPRPAARCGGRRRSALLRARASGR